MPADGRHNAPSQIRGWRRLTTLVDAHANPDTGLIDHIEVNMIPLYLLVGVPFALMAVSR